MQRALGCSPGSEKLSPAGNGAGLRSEGQRWWPGLGDPLLQSPAVCSLNIQGWSHQLVASALLGGGLDEASGLTTRPSRPVSSAGAHLEQSLGACPTTSDAWACLARVGLCLLIMQGLGC